MDGIAETAHDTHAAADYRALRQHGIDTARDGLRWHLIEQRPGVYDWSSFVSMLHAADDAGIEIIWDLCHFGLPGWADAWSTELVERFAAFVGEAARIFKLESSQRPAWCPVNGNLLLVVRGWRARSFRAGRPRAGAGVETPAGSARHRRDADFEDDR